MLAYLDLLYADSFAGLCLKRRLYHEGYLESDSDRIAFHTALAVTYGRPFTTAKGHVALPNNVLKSLGPEESATHEHLIRLRNKVFAHGDADEYQVRFEQVEDQTMMQPVMSISGWFMFGLTKQQLELIRSVISIVQVEIKQRRNVLESRLNLKPT